MIGLGKTATGSLHGSDAVYAWLDCYQDQGLPELLAHQHAAAC